MQEKQMVNDVLSMYKASLTDYARVISETSNQQLRQTLQQIRNSDEQFQFQLGETAVQKGYYQTSQNATENEINQIRSQFNA